MYVDVSIRKGTSRQRRSPPKNVVVDFQISIGKTLKNATRRSAMVRWRMKKAIRVVRRCLVVSMTSKTKMFATTAETKIVPRTICSTSFNCSSKWMVTIESELLVVFILLGEPNESGEIRETSDEMNVQRMTGLKEEEEEKESVRGRKRISHRETEKQRYC